MLSVLLRSMLGGRGDLTSAPCIGCGVMNDHDADNPDEFILVPDIYWSQEYGHVVIRANSGRIFALNSIGSEVWICLSRTESIPVILNRLQQRFRGVSRECLLRDLKSFMQCLLDNGICRRVKH
jgi:hypothetical protein